MQLSDSEFSYEEFEKRLHIVDSLSCSQSQKAMVLYGNSRSGKSTIYCGWVYREGYKVLQVNKALYLEPKSKERRTLIISSPDEQFSQNSVTQLPNQHQMNVNKEKILIVDCPGQSDSSKIRELINFHYIETTLRQIKTISFVIVILVVVENQKDYSLDDNQLKMLSRFMNLFPGYEKSVSFVVNKFQFKSSEEIVKKTVQLKNGLQIFFKNVSVQYKQLYNFYKPALTKIFVMPLPFSKDEYYQIPKEIYNLPQNGIYLPFQAQMSSLKIMNDDSLEKQTKELYYKKNKEYCQKSIDGFNQVYQKVIMVVKTVFDQLENKNLEEFINQGIFQKIIEKQFTIFTQTKQTNQLQRINFLKSKSIEIDKFDKTSKKKTSNKKNQELATQVPKKQCLKTNIVRCAFQIETLDDFKVQSQGHEKMNLIYTYRFKLSEIFSCLQLFSPNIKLSKIKDAEEYLQKKIFQIAFLLKSLLNDKKGSQILKDSQIINVSSIAVKTDEMIRTFNRASVYVDKLKDQEKETSFNWRLSHQQNIQLIQFYTVLEKWINLCIGPQKRKEILQIIQRKKKSAEISIFLKQNPFQLSKFKNIYYSLQSPQLFDVKAKLLNKLAQYAFQIKNYMAAVKLFDKIQKNSQVKKALLFLLKQVPASKERNNFLQENIERLCQRCSFIEAIEVCQAWKQTQFSQFSIVRQLNYRVLQISSIEYQNNIRKKYSEKLAKCNNLKDLYADNEEDKLNICIQRLLIKRFESEQEKDLFITPQKSKSQFK